jgi:hypothetical protein
MRLRHILGREYIMSASWSDVQKGAENGSELKAVLAVQSQFAGSRMAIPALTGYDPKTSKAVAVVKLTLFYEMGRVKICVNSPLDDRLGFVTLPTDVPDLAAAIDAALAGGIEWRKRPKWEEGASRHRR